MNERSVLISGASIAGPALAYWLARCGVRTTVVERAKALRLGGQNVDVRGGGREVARRMGIEEAIRAATTGERGVRFVGADGSTKAEFPAGTADSDGFSAELEVLRGDLARILYDRTRDDTQYLFGDHITALRDDGERVTATFAHGNERTFDLVVAADGIRSTTRRLVFGDEPRIRDLGLSMAYLTIPRVATDPMWARWYNAPGGRTVTLRPDNVGTTRATLAFLSPPRGDERLEPDAQKDVLRRVFADAGWESARVLEALDDAADLYFECAGQVLAPRWSRGRIALVGDAGYCASPISGMGTSLALVGAYVLAAAIAKQTDVQRAFATYESVMRPYATEAQRLPPGTPRLALPKTTTGIALFNTGLRIASSRVVRAIASRFPSQPRKRITLPEMPIARA